MTATIALLVASSYWAYGVADLKLRADPTNWIFKKSGLDNTICAMNDDGTYFYDQVKNCQVNFSGDYSKTTTSLAIGFFSVVLWFFHSVHICFAAISMKPEHGTPEVFY
jgi:hypothetical protein